MNHIMSSSMTSPASRSPLQEEHVERTRQRILDGLVRTMGRGLGSLSIPAVAEEAGVSVPTVYRHFRSKEELLRALAEHYASRRGLSDWTPSDPEELVSKVAEKFARSEQLEPALRAAMAAALADPETGPGIALLPERAEIFDKALAPVLEGLDQRDRVYMRNVFRILFSSATQRAFKDYLGLSAEEAAENVAWAMRQLIRSVENKGKSS